MKGVWAVAACVWFLEVAALGAPADDGHPFPGLGDGPGGQGVEEGPLRLSDGDHHFFKQNADGPKIAPALPADPMDDLERRVAPLVEAATGRTLLVLPPIIAQPRASVIHKLAAYHHTTPEALLQDEVLANAIALYVPMDGRIYVMADEELGTREARRWDAAARPDMPCVLAHELTHALQHQHGWTVDDDDDDPDMSERLLTVSEGQASWVEGRVCGWSDDAEPALGSDWPRRDRPLPDDSIAGVRYGHGLRFVEAVVGAWDAEAIWSFVAAPPTLDQVRQVSNLGLAPSWVNGEVLKDAAVALGARREDVETVTVPTSAVIASLGLDPLKPPSRAISHQAGWAVTGQRWLVWMSVPSPESADAVLQQVRWSTDSLTATLFSASHRELIGVDSELLLGLTRTTSRRRAKGLGVDEVLTVTYNTTGADRYETWVRRGDLILQLTELRSPTDTKVVDAALKSLLARPAPTQRVDAPADPSKVRALLPAPARVSPDTVAVGWFFSVALPLTVNLQDNTCERFVQPTIDSAPASQRQRAVRFAHACAVLSDDLGLAGALRSSLAVDDMIPFARGGHATLLASAGRWSEADAMIRGWTPEQPEVTQALRPLRISVAVAMRRWSEVATLGADPTLDPALMAKVGLALIGAGRGKEGRPIFELACRILPDDEREQLCE